VGVRLPQEGVTYFNIFPLILINLDSGLVTDNLVEIRSQLLEIKKQLFRKRHEFTGKNTRCVTLQKIQDVFTYPFDKSKIEKRRN